MPIDRLTDEQRRLVDDWLKTHTPIAIAVTAARKSVAWLRSAGHTQDEIVSIVHSAVIAAAIAYEPERGSAFATYAFAKIRGRLRTAARAMKPRPASIEERYELHGEPVIDQRGDRYREMAEWEMESDAGVSMIDRLIETQAQSGPTRERLIRGRNLFIAVHMHDLTLPEAARSLGYDADQSRADYMLVKSEIARKRSRSCNYARSFQPHRPGHEQAGG